jgi:spermidine/putrescine transport system permease protein
MSLHETVLRPENTAATSRRRPRALAQRDSWLAAAQAGPLALFFAVFLVAPLATFLLYSFWRTRNYGIVHDWNLQTYRDIVGVGVYWHLLWNTIQIAGLATVVTVVVAYLYAHALRFHLRRFQEPLLLVIVVALFSGYLVRVYAWRTILGDHGLVNEVLKRLHLIDQPLTFLLYNKTAAVIVLCNFLVPLAVLPIYAALQDVEDASVEVARDLGCGPARTLWRVTLPLARPGIASAATLCFIVAAGDYVTPQLVGGATGSMVGRTISDAFGITFDWAHGAALSFVILALVLAIVFAMQRVLKVVLR